MQRHSYETIEAVYEQLKALGAVRSTNDFSTRWLGMNESYLRCIRAKGTEPSAKVLARCSSRLKCLSQSMRANPKLKVKAAGKQLGHLAERCANHVFSDGSA